MHVYFFSKAMPARCWFCFPCALDRWPSCWPAGCLGVPRLSCWRTAPAGAAWGFLWIEGLLLGSRYDFSYSKLSSSDFWKLPNADGGRGEGRRALTDDLVRLCRVLNLRPAGAFRVWWQPVHSRTIHLKRFDVSASQEEIIKCPSTPDSGLRGMRIACEETVYHLLNVFETSKNPCCDPSPAKAEHLWAN